MRRTRKPNGEDASPQPSSSKTLQAAEPALPSLRKLHPLRFKAAEQCRNVWAVIPEAGTSFEQVTQAPYWDNVARQLRPADRVEVHAEDGSYFGELIVLAADRLSVNLGILDFVEFPPEQGEKLPDFFVSWRGPHHRHCVVRLKDGAILKAFFDSKDAAMAWLASNVKSLAA